MHDLESKACFMERPRRLEDLLASDASDKIAKYEIMKTIELNGLDYGNFITDLLADRAFIEEYHHLCAFEEVWKCILVKKRGQSGGLLIMPKDRCFVGWAAIYSN